MSVVPRFLYLVCLVASMIGVVACWQWDRFDPIDGDADADSDRDADNDVDGGEEGCLELGGAECDDLELCLFATITTSEGSGCCPEGACVAQGSKLLVTAQPFETRPTIDGVANEWEGRSRRLIAHQYHPERLEGDDDLEASFVVGWDASTLYLLVEVTDDDPKFPDSIPPIDPEDRTRPWQDDCVEIFLDMDPRDGTPEFEHDENQLILTLSEELFERDDLTGHEGEPDRAWTGRGAITTSPGAGWVAEIAIDWPVHVEGVRAPETALLVGFEIAVHDDDDDGAGATANNVVGWNTGFDDVVSEDSTLMGLLRLDESDS